MGKDKIEPVDIQAAKRDLLRMGRERGYITDQEIRARLPEALITPVELETFLFTMEMMGIERKSETHTS